MHSLATDDGAQRTRRLGPEERREAELRRVAGRTASGERSEVVVLPEASPVRNFAFDVTPARLVTGLITERGICAATREPARRSAISPIGPATTRRPCSRMPTEVHTSLSSVRMWLERKMVLPS